MQLLKDEDRSYGGNTLYLDANYKAKSLFMIMKEDKKLDDFNVLQESVIKRVGNKCEYCSSSDNLALEDKWEYDDEKCTRTLKRLTSCCQNCRDIFHLGYAKSQGRGHKAKEEYMSYKGINDEEYKREYNLVYALNFYRSSVEWKNIIIEVSLRDGNTMCYIM